MQFGLNHPAWSDAPPARKPVSVSVHEPASQCRVHTDPRPLANASRYSRSSKRAFFPGQVCAVPASPVYRPPSRPDPTFCCQVFSVVAPFDMVQQTTPSWIAVGRAFTRIEEVGVVPHTVCGRASVILRGGRGAPNCGVGNPVHRVHEAYYTPPTPICLFPERLTRYTPKLGYSATLIGPL